MPVQKSAVAQYFDRFARLVTDWSGSTIGFTLALTIVLVWAATGPIFHYSDTWQLVINTGTTIVTFLMVFLIQRSQNRESLAVQLKLDELIAAAKGASNTLISAEDLSEEEIRRLHEKYKRLAEQIKAQDVKPGRCHTVEEMADDLADELKEREAARRNGRKG